MDYLAVYFFPRLLAQWAQKSIKWYNCFDLCINFYLKLHDSQSHYVKILPHEHYGTPNICRAATGPTSPAALQTLMIVQPHVEQAPSSLWFEEEMLPQTGAFHVRSLTMHCHLQENSIEIMACFDEKVISNGDMLRMLSTFDLIFQQVCQEPNDLVEELKVIPAQE